MDEVQFVTIENGNDLILSFSFKDETQFGIDGFTIQRNPNLEFALLPHERGPSVDWTEDDEIILVKEIKLLRNVIIIKTQYDVHFFDISKISDQNFRDVKTILTKMNFDNIFKFYN